MIRVDKFFSGGMPAAVSTHPRVGCEELPHLDLCARTCVARRSATSMREARPVPSLELSKGVFEGELRKQP